MLETLAETSKFPLLAIPQIVADIKSIVAIVSLLSIVLIIIIMIYLVYASIKQESPPNP